MQRMHCKAAVIYLLLTHVAKRSAQACMQSFRTDRLMGHLQKAMQMPDCHCQGLPVLQTLVSVGKHDFDEDFGVSTRLLMLKQHYLKADEMGVRMLLNNVANCRHALLQCNILLKPAGYSVLGLGSQLQLQLDVQKQVRVCVVKCILWNTYEAVVHTRLANRPAYHTLYVSKLSSDTGSCMCTCFLAGSSSLCCGFASCWRARRSA